MANANKTNITKRSSLNRPLTVAEGDANFTELVNAIEDTANLKVDVEKRTIYAATVADMLALTTLPDGYQVTVAEYNTGTGLGGGLFVRNDSRAAENDGGSIIDGWERVDKVLTPFDFGVGDDGADYSTEYANYYNYSKNNISVDSLPTNWIAWTPPDQPAARTDIPGYFTDAFNETTTGFINNLWEPLRAENPDYVTRTSLGKDESGVYDVWKYVFEPPEYDQTVIVTSMIHGSEVTGMLGFYLLMKAVCEDWKKYPQLAQIRWRTRIVSIPILNPYGGAQDPKTRKNFNLVDINRNFDYRWSEYPTGTTSDNDYKGPSAFSEAEARYVRDMVAQYSDAVAFLDLHNFGSGTKHWPIYVPAEYPEGGIVNDVIYAFKTDAEVLQYSRTYNPTGYHYIAQEHGMYALSPEWSDGIYGSLYDGTEMTMALRWYGNLILAHSYADKKALALTKIAPRCFFAAWSGVGIGTSSTSPVEIPEFRMDIPVDVPGYLKITGSVTVSCDSVPALVYVSPRIRHFGYGPYGSDDNLDVLGSGFNDQWFENYSSLNNTSDRLTIPFTASVPVFPTDANRELTVGLFLHTTAGTATIRRYRAMVEFVPSEMGDKRTTHLDAFGRAGAGVGAMQIAYPKYP